MQIRKIAITQIPDDFLCKIHTQTARIVKMKVKLLWRNLNLIPSFLDGVCPLWMVTILFGGEFALVGVSPPCA